MEPNQGYITKRYILESLENNESNSELCELILELILEYPLQKYSKPMLLSNESALHEIKNITKMMREIISTDNSSVSSKHLLLNSLSRDSLDGSGYSSDIESGVGILLIHISAVFCRIMVEIFLNLSNEIEPHIDYWHRTGLSYQRSRASTSTSSSNSSNNNNSSSTGMGFSTNNVSASSPVSSVSKVALKKQNESMKSIALRRARVFKKLKQDLMIQTGHLQWWYYGLANVEKLVENHEFDDIKPFIAEMRDLFQIQPSSSSSAAAAAASNISQNAADGSKTDAELLNSTSDNINIKISERIRLLESLLETMIKSEAFVVKLEHDIKVWGMPPLWRQNFKTYAIRTFGFLVVSGVVYYKFPQIIKYANHIGESVNIFMHEHTVEPLKVMYSEVFDNSKASQREINVESLKNEASSLTQMIQDYEMSNNKSAQYDEITSRANNEDMSALMDAYERDIKNPIQAITKGSLLQNVLIQIQKMKVEVSRLLVGVDDLVDANRFNLEMIALIPGVIALWGGMTFAKDVVLRKTRYYKQIESLGIPGYNLGAKPDLKTLRRLFRQIHSLLVKNLSATYLGYEDCGIMLHLLYKLSKWGNKQLEAGKMSHEENEWLQLDIHHFISREFSIDQLLAQLRRMENYYLRL